MLVVKTQRQKSKGKSYVQRKEDNHNNCYEPLSKEYIERRS